MEQEDYERYLTLLLNFYMQAATSSIRAEFLHRTGGMADLAQRERPWLWEGATPERAFEFLHRHVNREALNRRVLSRGRRHIARIDERVAAGMDPEEAVRRHLRSHNVRVSHSLFEVEGLMQRVLYIDGMGTYWAVQWLNQVEHERRQIQARFHQLEAMASDSIVGAVTTLSVMTEAAVRDDVTLDHIPSETFDRGIAIGSGVSALTNAAAPALDASHARRNPGRSGPGFVGGAAPTHQVAGVSSAPQVARVRARPSVTARGTGRSRAAASDRMTQRPMRATAQRRPNPASTGTPNAGRRAAANPPPNTPRPQRPDVTRVTPIITEEMMGRRRNFIRPLESLFRSRLRPRRGPRARPFETQIRSAILSLWRQRRNGVDRRTLDSLFRRTLQDLDTRHHKVDRTPDNFIELFKMHLDAHRNLGTPRGAAALAELRQLERLSQDRRVRSIDIIRQGRTRTPDFIARMQINNTVINVRYEVTSTIRAYSRSTLREIVRRKLYRWGRSANGQWIIRNQLNHGVAGFEFSFSGGIVSVRFPIGTTLTPAQAAADATSVLTGLQQTYPHLLGVHVYVGNRSLARVP